MVDTKGKNITVNLTPQEVEDLDFLVEFFNDHSIASVNKSDVLKWLIRRYRFYIEKTEMTEGEAK